MRNASAQYSASFTLDGRRIKIDLEVRTTDRARRSAADLSEIPAGSIDPSFTGDFDVGSGQIQEWLREFYDESSTSSDPLEAVLDAWDEFHLSGMSGGTDAQEAWLLAHAPKVKTYEARKAALEANGMLVDRGYSYGSGWLFSPVDPAELAPIAAALAELDGKDLGEAPDLSDLEDLDEDLIDSRDVARNVEIYRGWARGKGYDLSIGLDQPECSTVADEDVDDFEAARRLVALDDEGERNVDDWSFGATLIRDSYFQTYAEQFADDVGAIDTNAKWPLNHIDWQAAANELKTDYTSIEFDGTTYWVR